MADRGITAETADAFGVDFTADGEWMFPYPEGTKYRGVKDGERYFRWEKGSKQTLYTMPGPQEPQDIAFICEGETDTMRLYQEIGDSVSIFGLPGIESWKSEWAEQFGHTRKVYVLSDNDTDYKVKARVDAAWHQIRDNLRDLGITAVRVTWPQGVKDVCEFFQVYDLDDFKTLLKTPARSIYKPLSFTTIENPPPIDWLVEDLIGQGDIAIMFGPPYAGKSVISMALASAIVRGDSTFLGCKLKKQGKVLYVDEENPAQVVYDRLHRMGIRPGHEPNLRYLLHQSVRLDREPEKLLEEADNFGPDLIVIDSITRIHTKDENSAGEMSALFNDGIIPLSRKTGATVLLIHHANKLDEGTAYKRMRGSADLGGVIDTGLDIMPTLGHGHVQIVQFKMRNGLPHPPINARFKDDGGQLKVVTNLEDAPPF